MSIRQKNSVSSVSIVVDQSGNISVFSDLGSSLYYENEIAFLKLVLDHLEKDAKNQKQKK